MRRLIYWAKLAVCVLSGALMLQTALPAAPAKATIAEPPGYKQVEAGFYMTTALDELGGVWSWGLRPLGTNMGGDHRVEYHLPAPVRKVDGTPLTGIAQIAVGEAHTVALGFDGKVWTWGDNYYGQLGNGTNTNSYMARTITIPPEAGAVTKVDAGGYFSMVLTSSGKVYSWGRNDLGQLGNRITIDSKVPVLAELGIDEPLTGIADIAAGNDFALALWKDSVTGAVYAWGDSSRGQLGTGITGSSSAYPVLVSSLGTNVRSIHTDTAADHSIAITDADEVYGWGDNSEKQLTGATAGYYSFPEALPLVEALNPTELALGYSHTLFVDADGNVQGLGTNYSGELAHTGYESTWTSPQIVIPYDPVRDVESLFAGRSTSFLVYSDGSALGWGQNDSNLIGPDSIGQWEVPTPVSLAPLTESGFKVRVKVVDYLNSSPIGCNGVFLYNGSYKQLGYAGSDGSCVFTDVSAGASPELRHNLFGEMPGYHTYEQPLTPLTGNVDVGIVYALPTFIPTDFQMTSADYLSYGDSNAEVGRMSGHLQWSASQWTGDTLSYKAYFVNASGKNVGWVGSTLTSNRLDLVDVTLPTDATGIQLEVTVTGSSGAARVYELPYPFPIVDYPANVPNVQYSDANGYEYDGTTNEMNVILTVTDPATVRGATKYRVYYVPFGEATIMNHLGDIPFGSGTVTLSAGTFATDHPYDRLLVQLIDNQGVPGYEIELEGLFDNISQEPVEFIPNDSLATPSVAFADSDPASEIGGQISWSFASDADTSAFAGYKLYFVDAEGRRLSSNAPILKTFGAYKKSVVLPKGTSVPNGAAGIGVFPYTTEGQEPTTNAGFFRFSEMKVTNVAFQDTDIDAAQIGGTVTWAGVTDETHIVGYKVVLANSAATKTKALGTVAQGEPYRLAIPADTSTDVGGEPGVRLIVEAVTDGTSGVNPGSGHLGFIDFTIEQPAEYQNWVNETIALPPGEKMSIGDLLQFLKDHPEQATGKPQVQLILELIEPQWVAPELT